MECGNQKSNDNSQKETSITGQIHGILSPLKLTQDIKWYTPIATEQWPWWQDWPRWNKKREEHNNTAARYFMLQVQNLLWWETHKVCAFVALNDPPELMFIATTSWVAQPSQQYMLMYLHLLDWQTCNDAIFGAKSFWTHLIVLISAISHLVI